MTTQSLQSLFIRPIRVHEIMTKWAKGATEFTVSVTRKDKLKTSSSYIPKPVLDRLGTPKRITFVFQDELVVVRAEDTKV